MKRSFEDTLEYLYSLLPAFHRVGAAAYKLGLENTIRLCDALGNPQNSFRSVHIGGTNGKGSVSHALAAILQKSGYKTGLYTSPHLVFFEERIKRNGKMVPQSFVIDFVHQNENLIQAIQPSFFEFVMAMAFEYFRQEAVDVAIIEVGMGGRLDSTNIIQPLLSIITNVSFDHQQFLGDTIAKIATEKAGIIKPNVPVIIGEIHEETKGIFENKAKETQSEIIFAEEKEKIEVLNQQFDFQTLQHNNSQVFKTDLTGTYQLKNIKTVLCAADLLKTFFPNITNEITYEALENVKKSTNFIGRMDFHDRMILVDVAHNVAGVRELTQFLQEKNIKKLHIVMGFVADKDISSLLALFPKNAEYYFVKPSVMRGLASNELKNLAENNNLFGRSFETVQDGYFSALKSRKPDEWILITGSCFVVGDFYSFFKKNL